MAQELVSREEFGWPRNTRHRMRPLSTLTQTSANPRTWQVPKSGILAGLFLQITGTIAGTLSAPNALGFASVIRRVRLIANSSISLIDVSGAGYHYLLRDQIEFGSMPVVGLQARDAITATTYDVSMYFPISVNRRDPIGLFMLQNDDSELRLEVEFESDANIATGITTHTNSVTPSLEFFSVPSDMRNWPPFNFLHTWQEENTSIAGAGEFAYQVQRGNTYLSLVHGAGIGATPADSWTQYRLRINQTDYVYDWTPAQLSLLFASTRPSIASTAAGATGIRELGVIPVDFMQYSGLGNYGSARDAFDSAKVTNLESVITLSGALTLYTLKRQLIAL